MSTPHEEKPEHFTAVLAALIATLVGIRIAYLSRDFFSAALQARFQGPPWWQSAILLFVITACAAAPLTAAFFLLRFVLKRKDRK